MSDVHDLGGRAGFGRVEQAAREPVFHARWEGRVLGLVYSAVGLGWISVDRFRHGIERMNPARYLAASYYERWLSSLEVVLAEAGVLAPGFAPSTAPRERGFARTLAARPRFAVGSAVRALSRPPARHCRLPGYASGKRGVVVHVRGGYVFPDANAHGEGECPQPLYTVRFEARELWGDDAELRASVCVDLFEPYLEAAEESRDV